MGINTQGDYLMTEVSGVNVGNLNRTGAASSPATTNEQATQVTENKPVTKIKDTYVGGEKSAPKDVKTISLEAIKAMETNGFISAAKAAELRKEIDKALFTGGKKAEHLIGKLTDLGADPKELNNLSAGIKAMVDNGFISQEKAQELRGEIAEKFFTGVDEDDTGKSDHITEVIGQLAQIGADPKELNNLSAGIKAMVDNGFISQEKAQELRDEITEKFFTSVDEDDTEKSDHITEVIGQLAQIGADPKELNNLNNKIKEQEELGIITKEQGNAVRQKLGEYFFTGESTPETDKIKEQLGL